MQILAIAIPRFKERYDYIQKHIQETSRRNFEVIGIDGRQLPTNQVIKNKNLSAGQIGCALSHVAACKRIVDSNASHGLIIEDDVKLPKNIDQILDELSTIIKKDEIIFLYNRNIQTADYSKLDIQNLKHFDLLYPMSARHIRTTAAYLIGREAAKNISEINESVQYVADDWNSFYQQKCFSNPRVLQPIPIKMMAFQSSIGYLKASSLTEKVRNLILSTNIGQQILTLRRKFIFWRRERNFKLVAQKSPLSLNSDEHHLSKS